MMAKYHFNITIEREGIGQEDGHQYLVAWHGNGFGSVDGNKEKTV